MKTFVDWCRQNFLVFSVDQVNDLGILLDAKLTFNLHRSAVISKAIRQLGFITKIARVFKDPHCLKTLYCSLVRPLIENASLIWCPHQLVWSLRIERVQKRFLRFALRDLPWRDPVNFPPYPDRCRLLGLDTLERRRKIQQAVFPAKLMNNETDSPKTLSMLNFRASQRTLRSTGLLQRNYHRTVFGCNEPMTACIRTFSVVENLFEFGEPTLMFKRRLNNTSLL